MRYVEQGDGKQKRSGTSRQELALRLSGQLLDAWYSHHSWNGRLDYQHKTRRKGELFTLSYMLALTRQRTEQENSCSLQRSFLSEDRLTVRISANDLFRKYRHYTDCTTQGDILGYSDSANRASMINFSISYRFGKLKASVKKTETTIDNSDVVGGITKGK